MFVFKPTTKTYSDPIAATFIPGIPFGREKSRGDICLLHEGFAASKIFLNSSVLREAILNSKEYLEEVLDIKISDKKATKEPKKVDKEAEIYIPEEPINVADLKVDEKAIIDEEDLKTTEEVVEETTTEEETVTEEVTEEPVAEEVEETIIDEEIKSSNKKTKK